MRYLRVNSGHRADLMARTSHKHGPACVGPVKRYRYLGAVVGEVLALRQLA